MAIKLVVFDIAGTTLRDNGAVETVFKSALEKFGYDVPAQQINPLMGYEKKQAIEKMLHQHESNFLKITQTLIGQIHEEFVALMVKYYQQATDLQALPFAEETMAALRADGIKVGINTGFSRIITESIIDKLQWRQKELFDYLICSDEVSAGRPDPAMMHRMMEQAGITNGQEVAKIGDTEVDIREGQNAGCKYVIAVTTGAFTAAELAPYNPTHILNDLSGVTAIITS